MTSPILERSIRPKLADDYDEILLCEAEQAIVARWREAGMSLLVAKVLLAGLTKPEMRPFVNTVLDLSPTRR